MRGKECSSDSDCTDGQCCGTRLFPDECQAPGAKADGETCYSHSGCDCQSGVCASVDSGSDDYFGPAVCVGSTPTPVPDAEPTPDPTADYP
ncbi:unnamed protein product, partial [Sphacelaria rigidula]